MTERTAIVTGASKGIGLEIARQLAEKGWNVAMFARGEKLLQEAAASIDSSNILALSCDVADHESVEKCHAQVVERFGPVTAVVNNAGLIDPIGNLHETDVYERTKLLAVNIGGIMNMTQAVLPNMLRLGGGVVLNLSSGAAYNPNPGWSTYCTSKAAVLMYSRCIDAEYADKGIRTYSFVPGVVGTDMLNEAQTKFDNPVSHIPDENKLPPGIPAKCIVWLIEEGAAVSGVEQSIRDAELRAHVGLEERDQW